MIENRLLLEPFELAYRHRMAGGAETILFVHGFGSSKEHFRSAFEARELGDFSLIAFDLIGFGGSAKPEDFDYRMDSQAHAIFEALDRLGIEAVHICAHSMGGLVGMAMAERTPGRILSFVNLEGNLTPEDCFFSGKIAAIPYEAFEHDERRRIEEDLVEEGRKEPVMLSYLESFRKASSKALHESAVRTVADSSDPSLVERFARIGKACYIYGDRNRGVYPGETLLLTLGVPVFYIADAGHSMAEENPRDLYRAIVYFITK